MKIGLFGGSFNPIHKGHIKIANEAIKQLVLDKLIFIPCQKNPFKKNSEYEEGFHRLEMIKLVLENKMEISDFEIRRKGTSYTIETVKYFKNKYKNDEIFLIIGSDNLPKLSKWKEIEQISKLVKISIFKRSNQINKTNLKKYHCLLINNKIFLESSTNFINGKFDVVDQRVLKYIGKNKIYFEKILAATLDGKRFLHSLHARDFAIKLAKSNKYPEVNKAAFAALVHDIAKNIAKNKSLALSIIKKYEKKNIKIEEYKWHQEIGYIILKHIFSIEDDICHAVRIHTSLDFNLTPLDKIVYLADKLCQGRKFENIQKIRKIALQDLDRGLKETLKYVINFEKMKNIVFTKEQEKIYEYLLNDYSTAE